MRTCAAEEWDERAGIFEISTCQEWARRGRRHYELELETEVAPVEAMHYMEAMIMLWNGKRGCHSTFWKSLLVRANSSFVLHQKFEKSSPRADAVHGCRVAGQTDFSIQR